LALGLTVPAQKKASDREFEGLKGAVKSVLTEYVTVLDSSGAAPDKKRVKYMEQSFDKDGRLLQILYPDYNHKVVYSVVDGFKTFISSEIKKEPDKPKIGLRLGAPLVEPSPIEEPEKLFPPDERYEQKYVYEYDAQGRVKTEREYLNNGKLNELRTFKYDDKNRVVEENVNDTVALSKFIYKYDARGNLAETLTDRDIKGPGTDSKSRTVYSDYKIDAQGNWTQRKSTWHFEVNGQPKVSAMMYYRTIIYY
jgi:hypothetical protein